MRSSKLQVYLKDITDLEEKKRTMIKQEVLIMRGSPAAPVRKFSCPKFPAPVIGRLAYVNGNPLWIFWL